MPNSHPSRNHSRAGAATPWLLGSVALLAVGGWLVYGRMSDDSASVDQHDALLHTVEQQDFELAVVERGEIESAGSVEVKSNVKSMNSAGISILRLVPEGTAVVEGDFLVELDSSALRDDRDLQQVIVNTAEAATVEAKNLFETAEIARQEYLEGTFIQERQTIESEVFVAEENLSRAEEYLDYSQKLAAKGYVNELQLEADRFAVEKSRKELEAARTKLKVLEDFTKAKMLKQLDSDIVIAKAKWESSKNNLSVEVNRLKDVEDQIEKCVITAPQPGVVKYAHGEENRQGNEFVVEEGAVVRERQTIIELPDSSQMQVAVTVNESLIQYVRVGMPTTVSLVGADDIIFRGTVVRVNQYAEPSNWRRANVKEYKAYVEIDNPSDLVKSGMTASVSISSIFVPDAVQAPVQAVYAHGDSTFCFLDRDGSLEAVEVEVGPTNDRFLIIESGLAEGDRIAANPRRHVEQVELPELPSEQIQQVVDSGAMSKLRAQETQDDAKLAEGSQQTPGAKPAKRGKSETVTGGG